MTESENEPQAPINELLDKIHQKISHQKSSDTISTLTEEESVQENNISLTKEEIPQSLITKYGEVEPIDDEVLEKEFNKEDEEPLKKRSWLKIFFSFLFVILLFNISYIIYIVEYKEEELSTEKKSAISIEVLEPSVDVEVEKKPVSVVAIEKMIDKPLEEAIEKAVKKLEEESIIPTVIQAPKESIPKLEVKIVPKEKIAKKEISKEEISKEEIALKNILPEEILAKNPNDYIDVIEMHSVSSKIEVIERRKPLSPQDKKDLARQKAKENLLKQMQN